MKRTPLEIGTQIQAKCGSSYTYVIDRVIGNGASSIVYEAHYVDNSTHRHCIRLKECYPYQSSIERVGNELVWLIENERTNDISLFEEGYNSLMEGQKSNYIVHAFDQFESNNTKYIVMDANEGLTFDQTKFESLKEILSTIKLLAHIVGDYHQKGYLHLDIKPSNFLVYPRPSEHIVLFDVDSIASMADIKNDKIKCISYSKGWAAPEQMQGHIKKLCSATDIYSIGAILFQKVMGRAVENEDIGIFADWDFDGEMFDDVNPAIKRLLREIFKKTLAANIKRRYQSANELISALDEARKVAEQDVYLVNEDVFSEITFVGREKDLANMHDLFSNGTKAIFLHGFGGVGKTALARRYAELYSADYDCVQFHRYTKDLASIIDDYMVNVEADDSNSHRKQLRKICDSTKALVIIDNFDVEEDDDLEYLLSLNVNLIFTTRNDYTRYITSEKIEIVELESLPTEELVSVFKNEYGKPISEDEEEWAEKIIEKFGNLTMLVPIIAKQILASRISIEEFAESIEDDAFARFDEDSEDIRIRKDGKSQRTNSLDFIRTMFNIAGLSDKHKLILRYLDLLKYHRRLTIKEYRRLTGEKNLNILNDLQFRNWISFVNAEDNEQTEIKVHQLIYDLVEKDDKPTYQNVPGIVSYIENCFNVLDEIIHEESDSDESSIDFEKASCITFALLMYDDIRRTADEDGIAKKFVLLYAFLSIAFVTDPAQTYELFFEAPKESAWHFNVNGIMDWYYFFPQELDTSIEATDAFLYGQDSLIFTYCVMSYYFHQKSGRSDLAKKSIEEIIHEEVNCERQSKNTNCFLYKSDHLLFKLKWYLSICQCVQKNTEFIRKIEDSITVSVDDNYDFYRIIFNLLKEAIQSDISEQEKLDCFKEAEGIRILLEQSNERFACLGLNTTDIMSYIPPTVEEQKKNKALHWSKKASIWYESVEKALAHIASPYQAYSQLLSYEYQIKFINNSKIKKLLDQKIVDRIVGDCRLSLEEKNNLLINQVIKQIPHINIRGSIKKNPRKLAKKLPKAELYFDAISKVDILIPDWRDKNFGFQNIEIIDAALTLRRLLKKEFFDINAYIESQIVPDNILYAGELFYLIETLRKNGLIKKSQLLKSKLLNLCLEVDLNNISEKAIQMILYKIRPLAVNYTRKDVVAAIDNIEVTVERKYHLALLDWSLHQIVLKLSDKKAIITRFLDDYINAVAKEAYCKIHEDTDFSEINLDEMELALKKYHGDILTIALATSKSYYEAIIGEESAYGKLASKGYIRSVSPCWVSEFHGSSDPIVRIGICYLIAQTYDSIPFETGFGVALEHLIYEDGEYDYQLSRNEIQTVLDNIVAICPKAKKEIDAYLKKHPLK